MPNTKQPEQNKEWRADFQNLRTTDYEEPIVISDEEAESIEDFIKNLLKEQKKEIKLMIIKDFEFEDGRIDCYASDIFEKITKL